MRLFLLTTLVMVAFAGNSILNRMALTGDETGPAAFAMVRLGAGALFLLALIRLQKKPVPWRAPGRIWGVLTLAIYVLGFSFAYVSLQAGVGALILFAGVQVTMFAGALWLREPVPLARWLGAGVALGGLVVLLWPTGASPPDLVGAILMAAAAFGWGIYSLLGRGIVDPLGATGANFALALPLGVVCYLALPDGLAARGAMLAVLSGAVTSGAGYALWYFVLQRLQSSVAAVAQLTVPLIAVAGGLLLLNEPLNLRFVFAAALVISGVLLSLWRAGEKTQ
ncbi:MAG: DMT family transporter [Marinosulfonomonas sp.]|nr:DMT family transporter [Marinosulfonomonas sp.]